MKSILVKSIATAALLLGSSVAAFAAPVAQLSCSGGSGGSLKANLSYFDLSALPDNQGNLQLKPLIVRAAISQFRSFYAVFISGSPLQTCVVTSKFANGDFKLVLSNVTFSQVIAKAASGMVTPGGTTEPTAYIQVGLAFQNFQVEASGPDDGGSSGSDKDKDHDKN